MTEKQSEENGLEFIGYDHLKTDALAVKSHKHRKNHKRAKKVLFAILCAFLAFVIVGATSVAVLIKTGKDKMLNDYANIVIPEDITVASEDGGKIVNYNGKQYVYNKNITAILCMGIDRESLGNSNGTYGANGQADANLLMVIDTESGKTTVININRDTMLNIKNYSKSGKYLGTDKKQLCLAFSNGDGKKVSCENTVEAVSTLFYGIPINSYFAIDLDAIWPLTSAVGNITVTPQTTFTYGGITYYAGKKTVLDSADKVTGYVRYRDVTKLDSNLDRMKRQQEFLKAFANSAINKTKSNITFPAALYTTADGYNENNIDVSKVAYLASVILSKGGGGMEFTSVPGTVTAGEVNAEYIVDNDKLFEMILNVFYKQTK